jgi:hypothetical protein
MIEDEVYVRLKDLGIVKKGDGWVQGSVIVDTDGYPCPGENFSRRPSTSAIASPNY